LNKLTPDNFDKLRDEILDLAGTSIEACRKVGEIILEKSWTEKKAIVRLIQDCVKFSENQTSFSLLPKRKRQKLVIKEQNNQKMILNYILYQ